MPGVVGRTCAEEGGTEAGPPDALGRLVETSDTVFDKLRVTEALVSTFEAVAARGIADGL